MTDLFNRLSRAQQSLFKAKTIVRERGSLSIFEDSFFEQGKTIGQSSRCRQGLGMKKEASSLLFLFGALNALLLERKTFTLAIVTIEYLEVVPDLDTLDPLIVSDQDVE